MKERYEEVLEEVVSSIDAYRRGTFKTAIRKLFPAKEPYEAQRYYDEKRICTSVYFSKYFTHLVPSDIIPDTELNEYLKSLTKYSVDSIAQWIGTKIDQYGIGETERALIYCAQHSSTKEAGRKDNAACGDVNISVVL